MADKKISALPPASTPLAGTEVLPIVQGGITEQVSVANLTAGRNTGMSNAILSNGLVVQTSAVNRWIVEKAGPDDLYIYRYNDAGGYAGNPVRLNRANGNVEIENNLVPNAGKGIDFGANTHAAGMTSELLNDYEEGTWTTTFPNQSNITGALTLSNGKYTRIGRLVMIEGKFSGNVTALLTTTFFQFTLPIARAATTDSGAGNVITANGLKLGGIYNVNADTTTAYVILPSNSGQPTGVDTFLFTYTYSA